MKSNGCKSRAAKASEPAGSECCHSPAQRPNGSVAAKNYSSVLYARLTPEDMEPKRRGWIGFVPVANTNYDPYSPSMARRPQLCVDLL